MDNPNLKDSFFREIMKMHTQYDWIEQLMVPSESVSQELSNEWSCR
jgi:hypothetical protein